MRFTNMQTLLGDVTSTDSMPELSPYIKAGLSANLCEAITGMLEEGAQQIETIMSWSPLQPVRPDTVSRVVIDRESREWVGALSKMLKEHATTDDYELHGIVVRLQGRPQRKKPWVGSVSVLSMVDNKTVQVTIEGVVEEDYNTFVHAHKEKSVVFCRGELIRQGRQYTLRNVRDVCVEIS